MRSQTGPSNPHYNRVTVACAECGSPCEALPGRIRRGEGIYCSPTCGRAGQAKKISGSRRASRPTNTLHYWRKAVAERDGYRCRICGFGLAIHVHHIISRRSGGEHNGANLIALCPNHHAMAHAHQLSVAELLETLARPLKFEPLPEPASPVNYRA